MKELYEYVLNFMIENGVSCPESIHQSDRIQEKLTDFACECLKLVENNLPERD